jgi:hypothetical protein
VIDRHGNQIDPPVKQQIFKLPLDRHRFIEQDLEEGFYLPMNERSSNIDGWTQLGAGKRRKGRGRNR